MRVIALLITAFFASLSLAEQFAIDPSALLQSEGDISTARKVLHKVQQDPNTCKPDLALPRPYIYVGSSGIEHATPEMLSVAFAMHESLEKDQTLLNHLSALIQLDLSDENYESMVPAEIGGVGFVTSESAEFLPITNDGRYTLTRYRNKLGHSVTVFAPDGVNGAYKLPEWARDRISYTFGFHLHATKEQRDVSACTPSFNIDHSNGSLLGDISYTAGQAYQFETTAHEFIVGKHGDDSFSVTYIGAVQNETEPDGWFAVVIPLNRYPM